MNNLWRGSRFRRVRGFTLVEAVVAIVITGIIAGIVAIFIRAPIQGYVDTVRRAELVDAADTSLRRIARDVRMALPNSLRETSPVDTHCIEFIPLVGGGRYRKELDSNLAGSVFDIGMAAGAGGGAAFSFDVLAESGLTGMTTDSGDFMVVNNTGQTGVNSSTGNQVSLDAYQSGVAGAPSFESVNRRSIHKVTGSVPAMVVELNKDTANLPFASNSPGAHFHVIPNSSVVYSCADGANLRRVIESPLAAAPLGSCPTTGGTILVSNVTSCSFKYSNVTLAEGATNGLLTMTLVLADPAAPGESVQLYNEVSVNNAP